MNKLYWLPAMALLASGCNFDLPTGTLIHDGSGELAFSRTIIASAAIATRSNPSSCVSIPEAASVSTSAEVKRSGLVEGMEDQAFDTMIPNAALAESWEVDMPRDGFTWHCFDLSDEPVVFTLRDTGTITYQLSGLDNQDVRILNTLDIVAEGNQSSDFAIFNIINEPAMAPNVWQPLAIDLQDDPNTAILLMNTPKLLLGERLLVSSTFDTVNPGRDLTVFDFAQDGTLSMRDISADASINSFVQVMADQISDTAVLGVVLSEEPYGQQEKHFAAWFTPDGESWERVLLSSTTEYDSASLAYNAVQDRWLVTLGTMAGTTDVFHIGQDDAAWALLGTESLNVPAEAFGATLSGTPLLLSPPLSEQNTGLQSSDILALSDNDWETINSLPLHRYFGRAITQGKAVFLSGDAADNSYLIGTITVDLQAANLPPEHILLDEMTTYDQATLNAAGRSLLVTLDDSLTLYSVDLGQTWQTVSPPADSLESYFLAADVDNVLATAPGGFILQLKQNDIEAHALLDTTSGELSLLTGNGQWAHYMTDGQHAYRLGLDSSLAEPELRADVMALPVLSDPETPGVGGRLTSGGGAIHGLVLMSLALLALRRRSH